MKNIFISTYLLLVASAFSSIYAQTSAVPITIAIFPFKNITGEVKYDSLGWKYADSLENYMNAQATAGEAYTIVPMNDLRDQMLAQNIDVKSPSYEGDVWGVAKALGAGRIVWGTYFVKYDESSLDAHVMDSKTMMPNRKFFAEKIKLPYDSALTSVARLGSRILPAMLPPDVDLASPDDTAKHDLLPGAHGRHYYVNAAGKKVYVK